MARRTRDRGAADSSRGRWFVVWGLGLALVVRLALTGCADADAGEPTASGKAAEESRAIHVLTTPAAVRSFQERLTVQGNLDARQSAEVGPKLRGTLVAILVDEGDRVVAGETPLFRTDDAKLRQAVEANRAALAQARTAIRESRARRGQTAVGFAQAKRELARHAALYETRAISEELLERVQSGHDRARAADRHARVLIRLARDQRRQAEVALAMAEQDLADATVLAPLSGVVTHRRQEPGEMGQPGTPIVRIDDLAVVEVSGVLPADVHAHVHAGSTPMRVTVHGIDRGAVPITYKSPTIDARARTFEVRCLLDNTDGSVPPGAIAEIDVTMTERRQVGVPERAVVERGGASYVFVVEEDRARMTPVQTGLETDGWVEVTGGTLAVGLPVVTSGQSMLEDGTPVRVAPGAAPDRRAALAAR